MQAKKPNKNKFSSWIHFRQNL